MPILRSSFKFEYSLMFPSTQFNRTLVVNSTAPPWVFETTSGGYMTWGGADNVFSAYRWVDHHLPLTECP